MRAISVAEIEAKLKEWASGEIDAPALHAWAEARYAVHDWKPESDSANEVLARLDMLNVNLTLREDVPVLIAALRAPNASAILEAHSATIDIAARRKQLAGVAFYAEFCK